MTSVIVYRVVDVERQESSFKTAARAIARDDFGA
jgi:hypothetical protein